MKIGVLALQGAFALHMRMLEDLGHSALAVRRPDELGGIDALVIPGGESTTMSMLLESAELFQPIAEQLSLGMPVLGTCAGMILLARQVSDGRSDQRSFAVLDIAVRRNGFGRQVDSFEADLVLSGRAEEPLHAVFIRAPVVEHCGPGVEVMATVDGMPVLVRQGPVMAASFHPELGDDTRVHRAFLAGPH